jgi:hypothetical protein
MDYTPPSHELSDIVRKHSRSYRDFIKEKLLECTVPGDRFSTKQMVESLRAIGHDVKDLSWWRDGEFMQCVFRKIGRGRWQRTQ